MAQKRAQLQNYQKAQQQLKINDRNQALNILNAQFTNNQNNVGLMQRQYKQQEERAVQQRNHAVGVLQQQTLQQNVQGNGGNWQGNMGMQGQGNMMGMQGGNIMGMQGNMGMQGMYPQMNMGQGGNMMGMQGMNPQMMQGNMYMQPQMNMGMQGGNMMGMQGNMGMQGMYPQGMNTQGGNMQGGNMMGMQGMNPQGMNPPVQSQTPQSDPNAYKEPNWARKPSHVYRLRLVENGTVSMVDLAGENTYIIVGRHDSCDIQLETPSVSRKHAVIQHRGGGSQQGSDELYIYDMNSTSGTFLNSQQLNPLSYYALQPGDCINFADSPDFVLCGGPNNYQPPLPITQTTIEEPTRLSETPTGPTIDDEIDAIINARCSDHLQSSMATLDHLFETGKILDEEYYKKKALIHDQMQRQQEEMKARIKQKKAEARGKQYLEDAASQQRAQQALLLQTNVQNKVNHITDTSDDPSKLQNIPVVSTTSPPIKPNRAVEEAFSSTLSSKSTSKTNITQFSTIKMDPRSADFDAVAYKRMMVDQYEQQKKDNEIRLRLRKLGDPTHPEFNPQEYKRLMIEKYEHERQMEDTK
eukprot:CAMPEP_0206156384 /NCGR_PEP_ID=MMETSP1474-20131121/2937_1 /ASSEMBLY_ACC=CAM_ASM_001110 /TAXON_ID=97495 /ORGANISM="Imantonia sp., Strain RCC918" /LENGTH=580 /DNA_ID=CAMNT_0053555445 /DNA_START=51 /DNA_END=1790 /DNA_ORIENTATION=-